jgi:hypothetical protein
MVDDWTHSPLSLEQFKVSHTLPGVDYRLFLGLSLLFAAGCNESAPPVWTGPDLALPEISAAGWINSSGVTREEMAGKVVVLDSFASW